MRNVIKTKLMNACVENYASGSEKTMFLRIPFDCDLCDDAVRILTVRKNSNQPRHKNRYNWHKTVKGLQKLLIKDIQLTALRLSASETAELDRCLNRSITLSIGDLATSDRRAAVTV